MTIFCLCQRSWFYNGGGGFLRCRNHSKVMEGLQHGDTFPVHISLIFHQPKTLIHPSAHPSIYLFVRVFTLQFTNLVYLFICKYVLTRLFILPSIHLLPIRPFILPSILLSTHPIIS